MGVLVWCFFGAIAGYCARSLMPGPSAGGPAVSIPLGVFGAGMGGVMGAWFSNRSALTEVDFVSLYFAISAALLVLLAYRGYALRFES